MKLYQVKAIVKYIFTGSQIVEIDEEVEANSSEEAENKIRDKINKWSDPYSADLDLDDSMIKEIEIELISDEENVESRLSSECLTKSPIMEFRNGMQ